MSSEDMRSLRERTHRAIQSAGNGLTVVAVVLVVLALASGVPQLLKPLFAIFSGSK